MNILRISRYHIYSYNFHCTSIPPFSIPAFSSLCSSGFPLIHRNFASIASRYHLLFNLSNGFNSFFQTGLVSYDFRLYSTSFAIGNNDIRNNRTVEKCRTLGDHEVSSIGMKGIIDIVKTDASDMESRLDLMGLKLSKRSIIEVFGVLNLLKVPALRFFNWVRNVYPSYSRNADLCSLALDNCARLGDFSSLRNLLLEFRDKEISLSDKAFGFLNILDLNSEEAKKSIVEIVGLLNETGGSCRNSGINALITVLCSFNLTDLVKYVIGITEKKASYYNILVKHLCVQGQLDGAREVLAEMSRLKCDTSSTAYNYLISSLCMKGRIDEACSIPNEMIDRDCLPTELTFEILIYFTCRYGRSDDATDLYNKMISRGLKPRLPTYSSFIRGYVSAQHFDEAYKYVVDSAAKNKWSVPHMYNILASLHVEHGDLLVAHKLILEMLGKGISPKPSVYRRVSNRLNKIGKSELAKILDARLSSLREERRYNTQLVT